MRRWMQGWNDEILERPYIPVGQQTAGRIIEMLRNAASSSKDPQAAGGVTPDYVMKSGVFVLMKGVRLQEFCEEI